MSLIDAMTSSVTQKGMKPFAIDLERLVLGACLVDESTMPEVAYLLQAKMFYSPEHKIIYSCLAELFEDGAPIDVAIVVKKLRELGQLDQAGGPEYVVPLMHSVVSGAHAVYHAHKLVELYITRELWDLSVSLNKAASTDHGDVFDKLELVDKKLLEISSIAQNCGRQRPSAEGAREFSDALLGGKLVNDVINTGFSRLDRILQGIEEQEFAILAARPSMGKTALATKIILNLCEQGKKVAFFSLEMSEAQIIRRLVSQMSQIPLSKLNPRNIKYLSKEEKDRSLGVLERLSSYELTIDDTGSISLFELLSKARKIKAKSGLDAIVVDYLSLITSGKKSNSLYQDTTYKSEGVKSIAKKLEIPIIALAQLSRAVESRENRRPSLADLRDSGAIEQDADKVLLLYRPEYYGYTEDEKGNSTQGLAEVIVAKNRNGATGTATLRFKPECVYFSDLHDS